MRTRAAAPLMALATALHGLTALFLGAAAGWWLLGGANLWRVTLGGFEDPGEWVPTAALGLAAVGVVAAPLMAAPLRRAGGWVVAALGVSAAHLISVGIPRPAGGESMGFPQVMIMFMAGIGVGGLVVALFAVRPAPRLAMVLGLVVGLLLGPDLVAATGGVPRLFEGGGPWWVVGLAVAGALVSLVVAGRAERGVAADAPAGPPARSWSLVWPLAVVAAAAAVLLAADRVLVEILAAIVRGMPPETTTVESLVATVTRVDGLARIVMLLALGAGLSVYGFLFRGRESTGRWVWIGVGAGLPLVVWNRIDVQFTLVYLTDQQPVWAVVSCGLVAAGAGVVLARYAGRTVPWDVVGLLVAAAGLVVGGIVQIDELQARGPLSQLDVIINVYPYLLGSGVGLAVAAGLGRLAALPANGRPPSARAADAALGIAAALLAVPVLTPLLVSVLRRGADPSAGPSVLPVLAVLMAAGAAMLFYVLDRVLARSRQGQASVAGAPVPPDAPVPPEASAPPAGTGSPAEPAPPDAPTGSR